MSQTVVFETPGLIPIESFTMMGVNAKPSVTNPIGHFGTGLKYAIAVLVREGAVITLLIGLDKYTFYKDKKDFRGKEFDFIAMRLEKHRAGQWLKPRVTHLPFTTELGKNWELWMAFRELYSNTLDENGQTYIWSWPAEDINVIGEQGFTYFTVVSNDFAQVYRDRDKYFLPDGLKVRETDDEIQVLDRPSKFVYYRGLMVHELKEPAQFTYNLLRQIDLTEDRTIKYVHQIDQAIANHVKKSVDKEYITRTVRAPIGSYERKLDYDYTYSAPSDEFTEVASKTKPSEGNVGAVRIAKSHLPKKVVEDPFQTLGYNRPWKIQNGVIVSSSGLAVLRTHATTQPEALLQLTVDAVNAWKVPEDYEGPTASVASRTTPDLAAMVIEPAPTEPTSLDEEIPF